MAVSKRTSIACKKETADLLKDLKSRLGMSVLEVTDRIIRDAHQRIMGGDDKYIISLISQSEATESEA